jgi:hypothetical protein
LLLHVNCFFLLKCFAIFDYKKVWEKLFYHIWSSSFFNGRQHNTILANKMPLIKAIIRSLGWIIMVIIVWCIGKVFNETGGYRQKQADINSHRENQEAQRKRNEFRDLLLVIGAIGSAIGTICLFVWDIWKSLCHC